MMLFVLFDCGSDLKIKDMKEKEPKKKKGASGKCLKAKSLTFVKKKNVVK